MAQEERSTLVGIFEDRALAQSAIDELRFAGFSDEQIGYAARNVEGDEGNLAEGEVEHETREETTKGVVAGGIVGGALGAAAALLIPGIGPVLAGGILLGILGGAAVGGATGGLIGALVSMGIPKEEAHRYHRHFESGRIIVTVNTADRKSEALDILRRDGAIEANDHFGQPVDPDFLAQVSVENVEDSQPVPARDSLQDDSLFMQPSYKDPYDLPGLEEQHP